jgi:hypothetical protein
VTSLFPASVVKRHKDLTIKHVYSTMGGLMASLLPSAASSHRALFVEQAVSTCERIRHRMGEACWQQMPVPWCHAP